MRRIERMLEPLQLQIRLSDALPDQLTNSLIFWGCAARDSTRRTSKKLRMLFCFSFQCVLRSCSAWLTLQS
jgi:hypothetical protein